MKPLTIAAAQSVSVPGNRAANVQTHLAFMQAAHRAGASLLLFPELSLTGYVLEDLAQEVTDPADPVLAPIRAFVRAHPITVILGAPLAALPGDKPAIGAIGLDATGDAHLYRKQFLHAGEEQYARAGPLTTARYPLGRHTYALAICADTVHPEHAAAAASAGASLYLAGVLISNNGYAKDSQTLQHYAASLQMGVLMANHGGDTGGFTTAGRSAFWAPGGKPVVQVEAAGSALLLATQTQADWSGEVLRMNTTDSVN